MKSSNSIHRSNYLDSDGNVHTKYSSVWLQNSPFLHNQQELATFYVGNFFIRMYHFNERAGSLTYVPKLLSHSHITVTLVQGAVEITPTFGGVTARAVEGVQ